MPTTPASSLTSAPGRELPVAVRASGLRIWDAEGREYLDACGGAMVTSLGHGHPRLVAAAKRQLDTLSFAYRFTFANEPQQELAELLQAIAPMAQARSFFNSSGSESVESAIHLALRYWQLRGEPSKTEFVSRAPGFHGSTLGALGLSRSKWRRGFEHVVTDHAVAQAPNADISRRRPDAEECAFGLAELEAAIAVRGAANVAAVVLEPISGASAAAVVPPAGYLAGVREICDRHRVLMVCDETITGLGRTGEWWGVDHWGVAPDVVTFAKGVTSGIVPFSGMAVAGAVAEVFERPDAGFPYGHTFSGSPLGCAVAAEAIRVVRDDDLLGNATRQGQRLRDGLERIATSSSLVGDVRGRGLLQGIELVTDKESLEPLPGGASRLTAMALQRGLVVYACPTPVGDRHIEAVLLAPPLIVTDDDVDLILARLADAVVELGGQSAR